jgi:hypothetical protein
MLAPPPENTPLLLLVHLVPEAVAQLGEAKGNEEKENVERSHAQVPGGCALLARI